MAPQPFVKQCLVQADWQPGQTTSASIVNAVRDAVGVSDEPLTADGILLTHSNAEKILGQGIRISRCQKHIDNVAESDQRHSYTGAKRTHDSQSHQLEGVSWMSVNVRSRLLSPPPKTGFQDGAKYARRAE